MAELQTKLMDRTPHSIEAEKAVIGCLLQYSDSIDEVFATITSEMFYDDRLKAIFASIGELRNEGTEVDKITAKNRAIPKLIGSVSEKADKIKKHAKESFGYDETSLSNEFFADILSGAAYTTNVISYCEIIKDKFIKRKSIELAKNLIVECEVGEKTANEICSIAQEEFYKFSTDAKSKDFSTLSEYIKPLFDEINKAAKAKNGITGVPTGYKQLDNLTAGFQNTDMLVLAGRPGTGKTTFALNLAYNMVKQGKKVLFFSLEMSGLQLMKRIVSSESLVESSKLRSAQMSMDEMNEVMNSVMHINALEKEGKVLFVSDNTLLTIAELRNKCQKIKTTQGLDIVFIDYLQLMKAGEDYKNSNKRGFENRQAEVAEISRNIKALAKQLDIPIVALSQLSREADKKGDPQISDLRESGAIEQDADIIIIIKKPKDENGKIEEGSDKIIIDVAKHRNGGTGEIALRFDRGNTRFAEFDDKTEIPSNVK